MIKIPWVNPSITDLEKQAVQQVLDSGFLGGNGPTCELFEKKLSEYLQVPYVLTVNNGTSALILAMQAMKQLLGHTLNIAVPTYTYIATANAVKLSGNNLVLVDSLKDTWLIDSSKIPQEVDVLTPVDISGNPCDYNSLMKHKKMIVADSSQAIGGVYNNHPLGSIADVTTFSFHASKMIQTGEGGAITCFNKALYDIIKEVRAHSKDLSSKPWEYKHLSTGNNYRMSEVNAAIGLIQLQRLPEFLLHHKQIASYYKDELGNLVTYQETTRNSVNSQWMFGILLRDYKEQQLFCESMYKQGIQVLVNWSPVHKQQPFKNNVKFPVAEYITERIVSLPLTNNMSMKDAEYVVFNAKTIIKKLRQ